MERCKKCGAEITDTDCNFCPSCGEPIQHDTKLSCPRCGEEIQPDCTFCPHCGFKLDIPSNARCEEKKQGNYNSNGFLTIKWGGTFSAIKITTDITVNGQHVGEYSFNDGYEVRVPITSPVMDVLIEHAGMKTSIKVNISGQDDYILDLFSYNRVIGSYKYSVTNCRTGATQNQEVQCSYFDVVIAFIIFPYGLYKYAQLKQTSPKVSKTYRNYAIAGIVLWILILL